MTFTPLVATDARIYLAGADLTGYSNKVKIGAKAKALDKTTFASGGVRERGGGLFDMGGSVEGLWDTGDSSKPDDLFWSTLGAATVPMTVVPTGGAVTDVAYLSRVLHSEYAIDGEVGEYVAWSAEVDGDWPLVRGQVLHPTGTARTATGNGTAVQLGALSATKRLYVALHVMSISGTSTPTITVKIQSDDNSGFTTPTDRVTFTAATTVGGQASSVAGAVTDDYWRATWTISGTTPSFLFAVSAGIGPK